METDSYTFTEAQLILLNASVNAWRGSSFWALMYMQSRLFDAENADSIYQELQAQPAHYDQIMERYYGVSLTSGAAADGSPLYHYYDTYLEHLKQRQRRQAEQIRQQWLELNRLTAQRLAELNPHWESSLWGSMFTHNTNLLCQAADQDLLGNYRAISSSYLLLDRLAKRRAEGLTTPKQIRFLEQKGFRNVGIWSFDGAKHLIDRIASNGWRTPRDIDPSSYSPGPESVQTELWW